MSELARPAPQTSRRRADAERSVEQILDATVECVGTDGEINMAAVARTAGLSRVTLYAHFPNREALLDATLTRAVNSVSEILQSSPLDQGTAPEALIRLLRSSWQFLAQHRRLFLAASHALSPTQLRAYHQPILGTIEQLIARGQDDGDFRSDLPRDWLVAAVYTLLHLAAEELNANRLQSDRATDVVTTTIMSLLSRSHESAKQPRSRT